MNEQSDVRVRVFEGSNVDVDPTATLGRPGGSFEIDELGVKVRCKHFGDIIIEDNVRIGPHSDIKRATLHGAATIIGEGTDICTFVNVGHNCRIGKNNFLGPHVCLNGSVTTGDNVWIGGHAVVHQHVSIGDDAVVGIGAVVRNDVPAGETVVGIPARPIKFLDNWVDPSFEYGEDLKIGKFNHIYDGVKVGDNCIIRSYVELRSGTIIGNECYIDSGVKSSGDCVIKDNVTLRYDSIIARGAIVEDNVFISPQLMTENLDHRGESIGGAHIGTGEWDGKTTYRVFIGTNVTLAAGIEICSGTIIGTKANVRKDIIEPGVYIGNPARRYER